PRAAASERSRYSRSPLCSPLAHILNAQLSAGADIDRLEASVSPGMHVEPDHPLELERHGEGWLAVRPRGEVTDGLLSESARTCERRRCCRLQTRHEPSAAAARPASATLDPRAELVDALPVRHAGRSRAHGRAPWKRARSGSTSMRGASTAPSSGT